MKVSIFFLNIASNRNVVTSAGSWLQPLDILWKDENFKMVSQLKDMWNLNTWLFHSYQQVCE